MKGKLLIRNAVLVREDGVEKVVDIDVAGGRIKSVRTSAVLSPGYEPDSDSEVFDARGWMVLPGVIDPHVHGRYPGGTKKETPHTLRAASFAGGVTAPMQMPNTDPALTDERTVDRLAERMDGVGLPCLVHAGAVERNLGELKKLARMRCVHGFKLYRAKTTGKLLVEDDEVMRKILRIASDEDIPVVVHSEHQGVLDAEGFEHRVMHDGGCAAACHGIVRSPRAEIMSIRRDIRIYQQGGYTCNMVFAHVSLAVSLEMIWRAKQEGARVFSEVTPHHLFLHDALVHRPDGTRFQVNPPLRTSEERATLFGKFKAGRVDYIGSDHAPHQMKEKAKPFGEAPSGFPGLETLLPSLLDQYSNGTISIAQVIALTSGNAAQIFGLTDRGAISFGKRADLVFVDRSGSWTPRREEMKTKAKDTPFDGVPLCGATVMATVLGGIVVYQRRES